MIPANEFFYKTAHTMKPRDGAKFATTYYKQTLEERKRLAKYIKEILNDLQYLLQHHEAEVMQWLDKTMKGHRKKNGKGNYTNAGVINDMNDEQKKMQKNGLPGDFAQAPIDRWNKIFKGCDRCQIIMTEGERPTNNLESLILNAE
jgi:hypothetical protein